VTALEAKLIAQDTKNATNKPQQPINQRPTAFPQRQDLRNYHAHNDKNRTDYFANSNSLAL